MKATTALYHLGSHVEQHGLGSSHSLWVPFDANHVTLVIVWWNDDGCARFCLDAVHCAGVKGG